MATSSFDKNFTMTNANSIEKLLDLLEAPPSPRQQQQRAAYEKQKAEKLKNDEGMLALNRYLSRLKTQ